MAPLILSSLARIDEHHLASRFTVDGATVTVDVFIRALDELVSQA